MPALLLGDPVVAPAARPAPVPADDRLTAAVRTQVARQVAHWDAAAAALDDPTSFAGEEGWRSLEQYLDTALRHELQAVVDRVRGDVAGLRDALSRARSLADLETVRQGVLAVRRRYTQAELCLEFYGEAVNRRVGVRQSLALRACDVLATRSMDQVLPRLGRSSPPVLTYVDKGMGASILRHGLRLWDPASVSPAATIKITRHNLRRPTSLVHEAGHQVAFSVGWNDQLADAFRTRLPDLAPDLAEVLAGWSSEISADVFAFATTGYASVAALHDVVAADDAVVFRYPLGDPHPIAYARVLLGVAMCRHAYGDGPWDDLGRAWVLAHPLDRAGVVERRVLAGLVPALPAVAAVCLDAPMPGLGDRPVRALVPPERVCPDALRRLEREVGDPLYTSPHWAAQECLRVLALSGLRFATEPDRAPEITRLTDAWMQRLGERA